MLTKKQQLIYNWLHKVKLPVYAEAYKGAVHQLNEKAPGYGTFVSHTGRDLVNSLARAVIGLQTDRVHYEQLVDKLDKNWRDEWRRPERASFKQHGEGHAIPGDVCKLITKLIEKHKEGRLRKKESGEIFIRTFLGYNDEDTNVIRKKWKALQDFFVGRAHLREEDFSDEALSQIETNFGILEDEFLYVAAVREYSRIKTLDGILEETNNAKNKPLSKKVMTAVERAVEKVLSLFEKEADRLHFFSRLKNPLWIQSLSNRGCFKSPPGVRHLTDEFVQHPPWPELQYLKNVSVEAPDEVVDIVSRLPQTENVSVYEDILDIALLLKGERSASLKPKILEYAKFGYFRLPHEFAELIALWTAENQTQAALELSEVLVQFHPDPQADRKREQLAKNNRDETVGSIDSLLFPKPQFDEWNYQEIMDKGVRALTEKAPFAVASMLIQATANMVRLSMHQDEIEQELSHDPSEIWCPRLDEPSDEDGDSEKTLILTMVYACEKAFEVNTHEMISALNNELLDQRWDVFERARQHLYALHPSDQTKPWIQDLILKYDYAKGWRYPYEFQQMIKRSCDRFGDTLLTEEGRTGIFDSILSGPERETYRERVGDQFNEADFEQWTREYHRLQFRPFASCLFGKYADYYHRLHGDEAEDDVTDETYMSSGGSEGGTFTYRSPRSPGELSALSDEDLLDFINEWQDEHSDKDDWSILINIPALAGAFYTVFTDSIIMDQYRLAFWVKHNRERIKRPIFIQQMIQAMQAQTKAGYFERIEQWCEFCQWVISHPDEDHEMPIGYPRRLKEVLSWRSSRRAVGDFVETCLKKEVNVPISAREGLASLLEAICTQPDWGLDRRERENEPYDIAINSTRGRVLRSLVDFGCWIRRHDAESEITEIESILEQRFRSEADLPMTIPEYALLGQYFAHIYDLNETSAVNNKSHFFPKDNLPAWKAGFGQFLRGNGPCMRVFEYVSGDYEFALNHMDDLKQQNQPGRDVLNALGEHLFTYYVRDVFPMTGTGSLLECFYRQFEGERERWANLFDYVGRELSSTGKQQPDETLKEKIFNFFEWRLKIGEPKELREFTFWLEAECLDADWRLNAYSRILEVPKILDSKFGEPQYASLHTRALRKMIPTHTAKVVECFAKLIQTMPDEGLIYIPSDDAKVILNAGRKQADENIRKTVERTQDDLLRGGQREFLDLDD